MAGPGWRIIVSLLLSLLFALVWAACGAAPEPVPANAEAGRPPNIVLIIADDLAYGDMGFMGSEHVETPRLDALAAQSTVLPNGYVTASVCVPSIRSLLTGLDPYQWSRRMHEIASRTGKLTDRLEQTRHFETLPERLREAGYTSFQGGKLWEASYRLAGFDAGSVESLDIERRGGRRAEIEVPLGRETMRPLFDFIDAQSTDDAGPFFVWFAPKLPHMPFDATREFGKRYKRRGFSRQAQRYYANITRLDAVVGELLDHLAARELDEDTLIVFLSDNGWDQGPYEDPEQSPPNDWDGPRGKRSMYDLGFRTPVLFRLPRRVPAGARSDALVSTLDVVATLFDYAGVAPPQGVRGETLRPLLEGTGEWTRDAIVGAMERPRRGAPERGTPAYDRWLSEPGAYFVRTPQWHYIWRPLTREAELYDIAVDAREENDLAAAHPQLTAQLQGRIARWKKQIAREAVAFAESGTASKP